MVWDDGLMLDILSSICMILCYIINLFFDMNLGLCGVV